MDNPVDTQPERKLLPESESTKHFRAISAKITKFLASDKPSDVLIIKAHLICEYYLNQILIVKGVCSATELNSLSFYKKNEKALEKDEFHLSKKVFESLKILNNLRNKVGHELEYTLSESDVDRLGFVQGRGYIFRKYDFESPDDLLADVLVDIAMDVAFILFHLVDEQKKAEVKPG